MLRTQQKKGNDMRGKPITKDFKLLLLRILKNGYMTEGDRHSVENQIRAYFEGYVPPTFPPLSAEEIATVIQYERLSIDDVTAAYGKLSK